VIQHLLSLLPREPQTVTMVLALVGSLLGLGLWLAGARFSRSMLTLGAVALGTAIGMRLPLWCGWSIDGMGPAVGGAVILGVSAYVLHRYWVGFWLGLVLAVWTSLAVWSALGSEGRWNCPDYKSSQTLPHYVMALWRSMPDALQKYLAICGLSAIVLGMVATVLWPRISLVLLWSAAGMSLVITTVATALSRLEPSVLARLPRETFLQLTVLVLLVMGGAALQWRTIPAGPDADGKQIPGAGSKKSSPGKSKAAD
jgi:hypothetical protein